jgi:RNA polymerase sigma-70 factor (ECF subfamily)
VGVHVALDFDAVYRDHFAFVWRSLRRLGLARSQLDDATQEVFLVVHRRLDDFDGRVALRSWLFGIAHKVSLSHRRATRHRSEFELLSNEHASFASDPLRNAENGQDVQFLEQFLDGLENAQRSVFILAELEQMSAPEIEGALNMKLNTVYSRLRLARAAFRNAVERRQAREP